MDGSSSAMARFDKACIPPNWRLSHRRMIEWRNHPMSEKKKKKPQKVKARLPRGFVDRDAGDIRALEGMMARIREVYERYGFDPVETPMFEYTDTLGKFLPDTDRPNEGVFSVQDDDEQWMSLRYDLTAPLARYVAEHYDALPKPYRSYRRAGCSATKSRGRALPPVHAVRCRYGRRAGRPGRC
jgi:hypothetical protein